MIDNKNIEKLLEDLVGDLVQEKYESIVNTGKGGGLSQKEIKNAIESYPGHITMPNHKFFSNFHKYEYRPPHKKGCLVEFELWYDEQESDLTLSAEILEENGEFNIKIIDIHVL